MIAVPLGSPLRYAIVVSPDYLSSRGQLETPSDLINHTCIRRCYPGGTLATWAFEKAGEVLEIAPEGRLTLSSAHQELQAAIAGQSMAHVFDDYARAAIEDGTLVELLADWSPKLPSWFLYYPNKRHNSSDARLARIRSQIDPLAIRLLPPPDNLYVRFRTQQNDARTSLRWGGCRMTAYRHFPRPDCLEWGRFQTGRSRH